MKTKKKKRKKERNREKRERTNVRRIVSNVNTMKFKNGGERDSKTEYSKLHIFCRSETELVHSHCRIEKENTWKVEILPSTFFLDSFSSEATSSLQKTNKFEVILSQTDVLAEIFSGFH